MIINSIVLLFNSTHPLHFDLLLALLQRILLPLIVVAVNLLLLVLLIAVLFIRSRRQFQRLQATFHVLLDQPVQVRVQLDLLANPLLLHHVPPLLPGESQLRGNVIAKVSFLLAG